MIVVTAPDSMPTLLQLAKSCFANIGVLYPRPFAAVFHGDDPEIIFLPQNMLSHITAENAVFISGGNDRLPVSIDCKNAIVLIDSADPDAMRQAAFNHLPAITCGRASSDTFTCSSWTADGAVICLQRSRAAFDGQTVEPFELPVSFHSPPDMFSLLCCGAIACLMGKNSPFAAAARWELPEIC